MFHKPEQMDTTSPSFPLSRNMTSPHMVPVIDLSLESDGRPSGEGGRGMHRAEAKCWRNVFHGKTHAVVRMNVSVARKCFKFIARVCVYACFCVLVVCLWESDTYADDMLTKTVCLLFQIYFSVRLIFLIYVLLPLFFFLHAFVLLFSAQFVG